MCSEFLYKNTYSVGNCLNYLDKFIKANVEGIHLNCLESIQMSTHNICYYKEVDITGTAISSLQNCLTVRL